MLSTLVRMLRMLPSKFTKREDSNIGKLLSLFSYNYDLIIDDLNLQSSWYNIDNAQGTTLDEFGYMVGIERGSWSDEQYRVRIKIKIAQNISNGTINEIIDILASTLNTDVSQIKIEPLWPIGKPATIQITDIPFEVLNQSGMSEIEFVNIVKSIVKSGIQVETINLKGTFVFSSINDENEDNPTGGFDVGTFGYVSD